jgi:membrane protein YqaA with SNARE-associated domain
VQGFAAWLLSAFLSPAGLLVLSALDSSVLFNAPLIVDTALVVLVAQHRQLFWLYPLLATLGALTGASATFWLGRKAGEKGLQRFVPSAQLERALNRARDTGAVALALLGIVPPPFPFTVVTLAAGALELDSVHFFTTLAAARTVRFGVEAALALYYGGRILVWMSSATAKVIGGGIILLTVVAAAYSAVRLLRSRR